MNHFNLFPFVLSSSKDSEGVLSNLLAANDKKRRSGSKLDGRTLAGGKMGVEIFGEKFERAFNGWAGHRDEVTKTLTFVESKDLSELLEDRLAPLALLNLLQQRR